MPYRRTENVVRRLAARRDAIVQAAGALAAEGGINAVHITPVAQRAGVATGTVYRYFPSKDDLVAALVAAVSERETGAMRRAAEAAPGPLSALAAAITTCAARALIEGLIGPLAAEAREEAGTRDAVQTLTLFALRGLGVADARARGLVVQTKVPAGEDGVKGAKS